MAWRNSAVAAVVLCALLTPASAKWKPEFASADPDTRSWYERAELTLEAQARFHFRSCCAQADVAKVRFKVDRTTGADQWLWLDGDKWRVVPPDIIHGEQRAPGGEPIMFVVGGNPVCFFAPSGGG